jgi:ABC-type spermidine/putrescine transport system permease subunit II/HEAT repeat protein
VAEPASSAPVPAPEPTSKEEPAAPQPEAPAEPESELTGIWKNMVFPNLTKLIDLSQFKAPEEDLMEEIPEPEEEEEELPSIEELPDFDDDDDLDLIPGSEDIEANLPTVEQMEDDLLDDKADTLSNLDISGGYEADPRVPMLLEALEKSEDPQFIIDCLYYLLEVKDPAIKPTIEKFVGHDNPLANYFAQKILIDLNFIEERLAAGKTRDIEPYQREKLFTSLFKGTDQQKIQILEHVMRNREVASVPYFVLQLLKEKNPDFKISILTKMGLLAHNDEAVFFGEYVTDPNRKVKLAAIEGLGCIGGPKVIPYLAQALIDPDSNVVATTREALKTSDKEEVASVILEFLIENEAIEKLAFITVLCSYKSVVSAFRALVWMLDDLNIQSKALDAIKNFELDNDKKAEVLEEYLLLSYDDSPFSTEIADYLEELNPSYNRSKLVPVNVFDESYVELVRVNPLFARDFAPVDGESDIEEEVEEIPIDPFSFITPISDYIKRLKDGIQELKSPAGIQSLMGPNLGYVLLCAVAFVLPLPVLLKAMGKSVGANPFQFLPQGLGSFTGFSLISDPNYGGAVTSTLISGILAMVIAWFIGASISVTQVKSAQLKIHSLAVFPLLIPPVLVGQVLLTSKTIMPLPDIILMFVGYLFPMISIFYICLMRLFAAVPRAQIETAVAFGAKPNQALSHAYSPMFLLGTIAGTLLSFGYLFANISIGYSSDIESFIGSVLLVKTFTGTGWTMHAVYGLMVMSIGLFGMLLFQSIIPFNRLFPSGSKPDPEAQVKAFYNLEPWMAIVGSLFFSSDSGAKTKPTKEKPKKQDDAAPDDVDEEEDEDEEDEE